MRTSSNVVHEQRELTLALGALDDALERFAAALEHFHRAGRFGWENDASKLVTRARLLRDRVEAAR